MSRCRCLIALPWIAVALGVPSLARSQSPDVAVPPETAADRASEQAEAAPSDAPAPPPAVNRPAVRESSAVGAPPAPAADPPGEIWSAPIETAPEHQEAADLAPVGSQPLGSHQSHFQLQFGIRTSYVTDDGYGLFERTVDRIGENYPLIQTSLGGGAAVWSEGRWSLAVIGLWEYGASDSAVRGEQTDLDVHRLVLGPELRLHPLYWLYGLVRLAPTAVHTRASLEESTTQTTLYSRSWGFGFEASAGAAFQLYGKRSGASNKPRLWAIAEGGYGWTQSVDLSLRPEGDDEAVPQRAAPIDLGTLAIRGPMFRVSAALTF